MNDFPEWIKLVPNGINSFETANRQNKYAKKYIRANIAEQYIRELESALSELAEWAEEIAGDCDDPVQSQQEDEMMDRINRVLMMDRINRVLMMDRINRVLEPPR